MEGTTRQKGRQAEDLACSYLAARGLDLLHRNYQTRAGEIDLIMRDGDIIVFVEVRSRQSAAAMHPVETIDQRKLRRIIDTGRSYLQRECGVDQCRFDVVLVTHGREIEWLQNAFEV